VIIGPPDFATPEFFQEAPDLVNRQKDLAALARTRYAGFEEGLSAQVPHAGPFSNEGPPAARFQHYLRRADGRLGCRHQAI